jgi:cation transport regulator ChaC
MARPGKMLASLMIKDGQKSGMVFSVAPKQSDDNGFGFAVEYIRSKMDDDRKQ